MKSANKKISLTNFNLGGHLNLSTSTANSFNEKTNRTSFFFIFYVFSTVVNSILASYLIYIMHKILIKTGNFELLYNLIVYVTQWLISSLFSIIILILLLFFRKILNKNSNFSNICSQFNQFFRFFIACISTMFLPAGFYFLEKLSIKDSKEYQLNFHENYILLYIFLITDLLISSLISLLGIYYFVMICLRLKKRKLEIDEEFIENLKDDLKFNLNHKNSTLMIPSDEFINNNIFLANQIQQIKHLISSPESSNKKKANHNYSSPIKSEDKSKIKQEMLDFAFGKEKKKENLFDEIKKEIEISNSPLKSIISDITDPKNFNSQEMKNKFT